MVRLSLVVILSFLYVVGCAGKKTGDTITTANGPDWEKANPVVPIPKPPLGITSTFAELKEPPTPERARLGRWLFFDKRISKDNTISCATCHRPEHGFSEPTPVSTGVHGQFGTRKAPTVVNLAWTMFPNFFWDGRAHTLEEQALGPIANPVEMGSNHEAMVSTLGKLQGYGKYFNEAFGDTKITKERVAQAISDYERTRMSGNSPYDKWKAGDQSAVTAEVKKGDELFSGKAACNQCHLNQNFTDSLFHNLGVGWDKKKKAFKDHGRMDATKAKPDDGAFKTPTLREANKHAPFMHDGSLKTLEEVVEHYNKGGNKNPRLDPKMHKLNLTKEESKALVAMLNSLNGEGWQDTAPVAFPQ